MKISVIIPCHNAAKYIAKALQSVAAQELPAHQIIVVNDASTDDSAEVVEQSGVPVRWLDVNVRSAGAARNAGIDIADGDWVAFLDADDFWYPHHLKEAALLLKGTADTVYMCHSDAMSWDEKEQYTFAPRWSLQEPTMGLTHRQFLEAFAEAYYFSPSGVIQQRSRVLEVGGYDPEQIKRADVEQFMRVVRGQTWTWNPRAGWCYRVATPGGLTRDVASLEHYMLRCLEKNAAGYEGETLARMTQDFARRAMSTALVDGKPEQYALTCGLAWSHLCERDKRIFSLASRVPWLVRGLIRMRRSWIMRKNK